MLDEAIELAKRGAFAQAEELLLALLEREPGVARAYNVLGVVQLQQGKWDAAEASLLAGLGLAPEDPKVHLNLGKLYSILRRPQVAERHLREAVRLDPVSGDAHFNLAVFLRERQRVPEAEAPLRLAIRAQPGDAESHYQLARVLLETFRFAESETHFSEALRLQPGHALARNDLAMVLLETGRVAQAQEVLREAITAHPGFLRARSNYVMCGQYDPAATDAELLDRAREAGKALAAAAARFAPPPPAAPRAPGLKVGLVSGDLHHHPVGLLLLPLLPRLRDLGLTLSLYSTGPVHDEVSEQLGSVAEWLEIAGAPDEEVWRRIRRDAPDILIDLAGHTGNNRLAVFAGRAAPRQVAWLGYFATTGTPNMDGVVMDPWHVPPGSEGQFSETVLRLPHTRFCFQPVAGAPEVAPPPSSRRRDVTFGSFNSIAKLNDRVCDVWARVLRAVPGSRLVLKWRTLADAAFRDLLAARFGRQGIDTKRIEFRSASDHLTLLEQYGDIDVALDPFPFTGGQTSFDAHWMGVPVVTLAGTRTVSRQTLCILGNLGLESLAASTEDQYVERALQLAGDAGLRGELRGSLRDRMRDSPLMDAAAFAGAFVDALRREQT